MVNFHECYETGGTNAPHGSATGTLSMSRQIEQEDIGNRQQTTGADGKRGRLKDCGGDYEKKWADWSKI